MEGNCRGCALPQGIWVESLTIDGAAQHKKKSAGLAFWALVLHRHPRSGGGVRPHVADMPEVDFL